MSRALSFLILMLIQQVDVRALNSVSGPYVSFPQPVQPQPGLQPRVTPAPTAAVTPAAPPIYPQHLPQLQQQNQGILDAPILEGKSFSQRFRCMMGIAKALFKGERPPPGTDLEPLDLSLYTGGTLGAYQGTKMIAKPLFKHTGPSVMGYTEIINWNNWREVLPKMAEAAAKKSAKGAAALSAGAVVGVPLGAAAGMMVAKSGLEVGKAFHRYILPNSSETEDAFMGAGLASGVTMGLLNARNLVREKLPFLARFPEPYRTGATLLAAAMVGASGKLVIAKASYVGYYAIRDKGQIAFEYSQEKKDSVITARNLRPSHGIIRKLTIGNDFALEIDGDLEPITYHYDPQRGAMRMAWTNSGKSTQWVPVSNNNNPFLAVYLQQAVGKSIPLSLPKAGRKASSATWEPVTLVSVAKDVSGYLASSITVRRANGNLETFSVNEIEIPKVGTSQPNNIFAPKPKPKS